MNAFADVMFSLLLGWLRGFIGEVWTLVTSGAGEGFLAWIGGNWLWITILICVIGTAIDYVVWFARWRPDKLWRARLSAMRLRRPGESKRTRSFTRGYREGIDMDWLGQQEAAAPSAPVPEEYDPRAAYAGDAPADLQAYDERAYMPPAYAEAYPQEIARQAGRRRRSDRRAAGTRRITGRLTRDDDEDDRMIDGLPPLIDKEQAYHTPVYPDAPAGASAAPPWEDADDDNG